jgi:hypothetical protein
MHYGNVGRGNAGVTETPYTHVEKLGHMNNEKGRLSAELILKFKSQTPVSLFSSGQSADLRFM